MDSHRTPKLTRQCVPVQRPTSLAGMRIHTRNHSRRADVCSYRNTCRNRALRWPKGGNRVGNHTVVSWRPDSEQRASSKRDGHDAVVYRSSLRAPPTTVET